MLGQYKESAGRPDKGPSPSREQLSDLLRSCYKFYPWDWRITPGGDYVKAGEFFGWNATHLEGDLASERFGMFVPPSAFHAVLWHKPCRNR